mmetsp:Transcript_23601/g.78137  ORF Transcript_23601/g.78137 Transcript_23601/m.78137 type:complete len:408 (-) Transcript_23601:317-1540(-)
MLNLLVERLREVGRGLVAADVDVRGARDEGPVGEGHGLDGRDAAAPLRAARPRRARERALERPRERRPRGPDLPRDGLADVLGVAPGVQRLAQGAALRRRHDGDDVGAQRPVLEAEPPRRLVLRGLERAVGARVDVVREGAPAAPLERGRRVRVGLLADPEDLVQEAVGLRAVVVAPRGRARAPRGVVVVVGPRRLRVAVGEGLQAPRRDVGAQAHVLAPALPPGPRDDVVRRRVLRVGRRRAAPLLDDVAPLARRRRQHDERLQRRLDGGGGEVRVAPLEELPEAQRLVALGRRGAAEVAERLEARLPELRRVLAVLVDVAERHVLVDGAARGARLEQDEDAEEEPQPLDARAPAAPGQRAAEVAEGHEAAVLRVEEREDGLADGFRYGLELREDVQERGPVQAAG